MLCYAMLCYAMLCYANAMLMLYYANAILCYAILPGQVLNAFTHVLRAFRGNSVTARGTTAIPSSPTSHTLQVHACPGGTPGSPETLARGQGFDKDLARLTSSVVVVASPEAWC